MLHDAGSWHFEFNALVTTIRERLLAVAGLSSSAGWEAILLQGSGTYGVEAVFLTCVPPNGKVAVLTNGAYGNRIVQMLSLARIDHVVLRTPENIVPDPKTLEDLLKEDRAITHVAVVHCETTTGILNPIAEIGAVVRAHKKTYIVDAMSSFGGIPMDISVLGIDYLISSANKCLEGVPGFCFVICRGETLAACEGYARSLSLDLLGQLKGFRANGQFRFTPPTHALLAFDQALNELDSEGGVAARSERYRRNHEVLLAGMAEAGFMPYLEPRIQSHLITAFAYPKREGFSFDQLNRQLSDRGFIIYPGKLTQIDTFRIGTIGRIFPEDLRQLSAAIRELVKSMNK